MHINIEYNLINNIASQFDFIDCFCFHKKACKTVN